MTCPNYAVADWSSLLHVETELFDVTLTVVLLNWLTEHIV